MGAKTWMLVYADRSVGEALKTGPRLDRDLTRQLAAELFPKYKLEPIGDGDLSYTCPQQRTPQGSRLARVLT